MTANRRIFLNFIATYGRSLFAMACGLFSGRWILEALGTVDYGLWGCVGGLVAFVTFINDLMAGAVSRFYAVSVGKAGSRRNEDLEDCQRWFNTALIIHTFLPTVLIIVGYPIGKWAIENYLNIAGERVLACVWVWRFTCISCFCGMINVPFRAMYVAKQEIAELTGYSVIQTLSHFVLAAWMAWHPGDWLAKYALLVCFLGIIPQCIILVRALCIFPECKVFARYMFLKDKFSELWKYVTYRFCGAFADLLQNQGVSILVNKIIGPLGNATMTVGNTVASHTVTLSTAMSTAIGPAIYNAYGAGDYSTVRKLAMQASKMGGLLYLLIVLPVAMEVHYLIDLWLVTPPAYAGEICLFVMAAYLTERMSDGQVCTIYATGDIKAFQRILCVLCLIGLGLAWIFLTLGYGIFGVGLSIIIFKILIMIARGWFAWKVFKLSIRDWYTETLQPMFITIVVCVEVGYIIHLMQPSFLRLMTSVVVVELVFLFLAWFMVLNSTDRLFVRERILSKILHR